MEPVVPEAAPLQSMYTRLKIIDGFYHSTESVNYIHKALIRQKGQSYHEAYCPMGAAAEGSPVGVKVAAAKPHPYLFASDILAVDEHLLLCPEVDIMSGPLQG